MQTPLFRDFYEISRFYLCELLGLGRPEFSVHRKSAIPEHVLSKRSWAQRVLNQASQVDAVFADPVAGEIKASISTVAVLFSKMALTGRRIAMVDMGLLVFQHFHICRRAGWSQSFALSLSLKIFFSYFEKFLAFPRLLDYYRAQNDYTHIFTIWELIS